MSSSLGSGGGGKEILYFYHQPEVIVKTTGRVFLKSWNTGESLNNIIIIVIVNCEFAYLKIILT